MNHVLTYSVLNSYILYKDKIDLHRVVTSYSFFYVQKIQIIVGSEASGLMHPIHNNY